MDEYKAVEQQMNEIIDKRMDMTNFNQQWNYNRQVAKLMQSQPFKYQPVQLPAKVELTDDIRDLIYNENQHPDDLRMFQLNQWHLSPISEVIVSPPSSIYSGVYVRQKKADTGQIDAAYGKIVMEGNLKGKSNEINYIRYHFNLRTHALVIYRSEKVDDGDKQLFFIPLNETTFDYQSDGTDFMLLKGPERNLRIFKDESSKLLINQLQNRLLYFAYRGTCALRNQTPHYRFQDYYNKVIESIGPIEFNHENAIKQITKIKTYRQSVGAFFKLLQRVSRRRKNKAGQIFYPNWLKQQFRDLPRMETWLSTNVIPPQHPLMSLKIKINQNEKKGLFHTLKYIFPYLKNYVKRSIVIYESQLIDEDAKRILQNISFPMNMVGFPQNLLSLKTLQYCIIKSSDLNNQIIDLSYNKKLITIGGTKTLNLINNNPSVKKLILRGCQVANGEQGAFFDALGSNLCLEELELDYSEYYNPEMVQFLDEFEVAFE